MIEENVNTQKSIEETNRKNIRNRRLLWVLIFLDILMVGYLAFQLIFAITNR